MQQVGSERSLLLKNRFPVLRSLNSLFSHAWMWPVASQMGRGHPKTANVRGASIEIEREFHAKQGKILVIRVIG
jgi:hypothetical protein